MAASRPVNFKGRGWDSNNPGPPASKISVDIKNVGRDGVTYHAMVDVKNPYSHSLPVCELSYTLKSDGWYFRVIIGRIGCQDEDSSLLFQLLSSVVEAGSEEVAVHIPALIGTVAKCIPSVPEPWPQQAIQQCCIQLKLKIVKRIQVREQKERKRNLSKYIPNAANAVYDVLKEMAQQHMAKKRRYEGKDAEILQKVATRALTAETLKEKLAKHVEQVDHEMALEYATQTGASEETKDNVYIQSLGANEKCIDLKSPVFISRLFQ